MPTSVRPASTTSLGKGRTGADRIGEGESGWYIEVGDQIHHGETKVADHATAIDLHLDELTKANAIKRMDDIQAIGFKAVHGGSISGAVIVSETVIATMEQFSDVAPQHNPPYIAAMRAFRDKLPHVPQVAAFETSFHQNIPACRQLYGIPFEWASEATDGGLGIRRYGFHGASHNYIATRMSQLVPDALRIVSCHLGGSNSICAIDDGKSVANSFGMTTQSGVFHSSRVGDFDTFALFKLVKSGLDMDTVWKKLSSEAGLKGLSGVSSDMREVEEAALKGNKKARLAIDTFVESCRHYIGADLAVLNGADAIVFTGGIGQHSAKVRSQICVNLENLGVKLDLERNATASGSTESRIDIDAASTASGTQVWVIPTNEEIIIARQAVEVLGSE